MFRRIPTLRVAKKLYDGRYKAHISKHPFQENLNCRPSNLGHIMTGSTADQLLKWGISNSSSDAHRSIAALGEDIQSGKRSDLADPELYQKLMGPSEAELMKEQLSVAANPQRDVVDRATALDNFEMVRS